MRAAIEVHRLGKRYRRFDARRPGTLQEAVASGFRNMGASAYQWSLREVTFELQPGRVLGVIGRNGAGKSTLLRVIGGVLRPDEGTVEINGRLGGLLELTAGFHPDLTGRENVEIGGVVRGLSRAEVRRRFESIVEFAELHEAIDRPLRTYSSGMQMRLAFAVAVNCEPDVLLVDEVLAVGDAAFQNKCLDRVRELRSGGCSILLVSHDTALVEQMCDDALWLKDGKVASFGPVAAVARDYIASLRDQTRARTAQDAPPAITSQGVVLRPGRNRFGAQEVELTDVRLATESDSNGLELNDGDWLSVAIDYVVNEPVESAVFSVTLIHDDGRAVMSATTEGTRLDALSAARTGAVTLRWPQVAVDPGTYFIEVGVYRSDWTYAFDYHARSYTLIVRDRSLVGAGRLCVTSERSRPEWFFDQEEVPRI